MNSNNSSNSSSNLMDCRKRVRRGESFGRMGVDRTISNSLKSPSRQKQKQHSVRFAEETPFIYLCSHFDKGMTPAEKEQRKQELWYTRHDFEAFLQERISTIRLLRAVHGDAMALRRHCPDLCLRGLEPFQCDTLNQEMQCQRQLHQNVVLAEQTLQKTHKVPDPEAICRLAQARSEWARQRARQLANLDELEVKIIETSSSLDERRRSLSSAQIGMENLMLTQQQQQRRSSMSTALGLSTVNPRRVPVDLAILKEWNAKFLQDIRQKSGTHSTYSLPVAATVLSLSEKTAESRRALQHSLGSLPQAASSTLGYGEVPKDNNNHNHNNTAGPSFRFPVRRDSLVGLRRESFLAKAPPSAMGTLAAAAAAVSAGGAVTEACFRFPVRRDSLSNVHWN